jgi:hypothetical protein
MTAKSSSGYRPGSDISGDYSSEALQEDFDLINEIIERQGFNAPATVMAKDALTAYAEEHGTPLMYRGLHADSDAKNLEYANKLKASDMYISDSGGSTAGKTYYVILNQSAIITDDENYY